MKIKVFLFLLIQITFNPLIAQESSFQNKVDRTFIIDGLTNDWPHDFLQTDTYGEMYYSFKFDNNSLYLCFQTFIPAIQQKILNSGVLLKLKSKGKNKVNAQIEYPLKSDLERDRRPANRPVNKEQFTPSRDSMDIRSNRFEWMTDMKTKGFISQNGTMPTSGQGIEVAINRTMKNSLCYEIRIPFKELYAGGLNNENINNPITIKMTIDAISAPGSRPGASGSMRPGSGGGGRRSGGGAPGGMRSGGGRSSGGMRPGGAGMNTGAAATSSNYKLEIHLNNSK
ncbi:MAG TPA: hypothetical protein DEQ09_00440 [Bacteroidales bacterium]|nr:hypothetical protein [Bacteroidales bacterium]